MPTHSSNIVCNVVILLCYEFQILLTHGHLMTLELYLLEKKFPENQHVFEFSLRTRSVG